MTKDEHELVESLTYDDGLYHGLAACKVLNSLWALNGAGLRPGLERIAESAGLSTSAPSRRSCLCWRSAAWPASPRSREPLHLAGRGAVVAVTGRSGMSARESVRRGQSPPRSERHETARPLRRARRGHPAAMTQWRSGWHAEARHGPVARVHARRWRTFASRIRTERPRSSRWPSGSAARCPAARRRDAPGRPGTGNRAAPGRRREQRRPHPGSGHPTPGAPVRRRGRGAPAPPGEASRPHPRGRDLAGRGPPPPVPVFDLRRGPWRCPGLRPGHRRRAQATERAARGAPVIACHGCGHPDPPRYARSGRCRRCTGIAAQAEVPAEVRRERSLRAAAATSAADKRARGLACAAVRWGWKEPAPAPRRSLLAGIKKLGRRLLGR